MQFSRVSAADELFNPPPPHTVSWRCMYRYKPTQRWSSFRYRIQQHPFFGECICAQYHHHHPLALAELIKNARSSRGPTKYSHSQSCGLFAHPYRRRRRHHPTTNTNTNADLFCLAVNGDLCEDRTWSSPREGAFRFWNLPSQETPMIWSSITCKLVLVCIIWHAQQVIRHMSTVDCAWHQYRWTQILGSSFVECCITFTCAKWWAHQYSLIVIVWRDKNNNKNIQIGNLFTWVCEKDHTYTDTSSSSSVEIVVCSLNTKLA